MLKNINKSLLRYGRIHPDNSRNITYVCCRMQTVLVLLLSRNHVIFMLIVFS
ncbi:hypothetical protein KsCSTR_08670 [Candidatus Kuenenia stuttgartiensis]|uniref:Uncharacterized protein n=1 Tax=Kuenenia stuttgartiensis TaxID=174633 RepID=Q1PZ84_KUEST|nr:hypothetical protein KsCSTR_08670 [Candidatus Kuenenia stuttgartiensis]CAJ72386.1 unknown protein [Candidatus Kuenenia stuttgartiensis]